MPAREQATAGKPVRIMDDISRCLGKAISDAEKYDCIVIISRYGTGKTTSAVRIITEKSGKNNIEYITLTRQDKKTDDRYPEPTIKFGEVPKNKTIIFDELHSDENISPELIDEYIKELLKHNRVIILTNPYGSSSDADKETKLFINQEKDLLPAKTLFFFVTNKKENI